MVIQTQGSKKSTCKHCISRRERGFQKKVTQVLVDIQQQKEEVEDLRFTVVSLDESFFFHDSLVRRAWIDESKRPIVRVTCSHKHSCIFGAISIEGNQQLFRQYDRFNGAISIEGNQQLFRQYYRFNGETFL